jgi:hypothetical protein
VKTLAVALVMVMSLPALAADHSAVYQAWVDCPAHPRYQRASVTVIISDTEARGFSLGDKRTRFICL